MKKGYDDMSVLSQENKQELILLRQEFHRIPETEKTEEKTCQKILETLNRYGITNAKRLFHTSVVATIGKESLPCIGLRMDIDGLPIEEKTGLPFSSQHTGRMHACGHDAHIAILLMTAKLLKKQESSLPVCVKLIFQPAEEGDGGALPMIAEGVLKDPATTKIFGAHVWPELPVGTVELVEGASFAGCDRFTIKFTGTGGHGALPHLANSPLYPMAACILKLNELQKAEKKAVISPCACEAQGFYNIFPDQAQIKGTLRTLTQEDRLRILRQMETLITEIGDEYGVSTEFLPVEEYSPCYNHPDCIREYRQAAEAVLGKSQVKTGTASFAADDFSEFTKRCPGAHLRIGSQGGKGTSYPLHSPRFDIDEACLWYGVEILYRLITDR